MVVEIIQQKYCNGKMAAEIVQQIISEKMTAGIGSN